jgi:DNA ligase-3
MARILATVARSGRSVCRQCHNKISLSSLRIGTRKTGPGYYTTLWFHLQCFFKKKSSKKLTDLDSSFIFTSNNPKDREDLQNLLDINAKNMSTYYTLSGTPIYYNKFFAEDKEDSSKNTFIKKYGKSDIFKDIFDAETERRFSLSENRMPAFIGVVDKLSKTSSNKTKIEIIRHVFSKICNGVNRRSDDAKIICMWLRFLIPSLSSMSFKMKDHMILKIFADAFNVPYENLLESFEQNRNVLQIIGKLCEDYMNWCNSYGETFKEHINPFGERFAREFVKSRPPVKMCDMNMYLKSMMECTSHTQRVQIINKLKFRGFTMIENFTPRDFDIFVRLLRGSLEIGAGQALIFSGLHKNANEMYKICGNLESVVDKYLKGELDMDVCLGKPIAPMLADMACSSREVFNKLGPNVYCEEKLGGERIHVHNDNGKLYFFDKNKKLVVENKISIIREHIQDAFKSKNFILDGKILLVDKNDTILPVTLGKRSENRNSKICFFVFDCIYMDDPIHKLSYIERRNILIKNYNESKYIKLVKSQFVENTFEMNDIIMDVIFKYQEGIILKSSGCEYSAGKHRWLKIKKDYVCNERRDAMIDTVNLIVLGAWLGTGVNRGKYSSFLMGYYDKESDMFIPVTKVRNGLSKEFLDNSLQRFKMHKITQADYGWLRCIKRNAPTMVINDPHRSEVWEIGGAKLFIKNESISIRFPRVLRIYDVMNAETSETIRTKLFDSCRKSNGEPRSKRHKSL